MIVFGISKSLPLSLAALCVSGFVDMISVNIRQTAVADAYAAASPGRVSAVEWVFISASNELGAFESGRRRALIGTVPAVVAGGAAMIGIAATWSRAFPALARMGKLADLRPSPYECATTLQALLEAHVPADAKEAADRAAMLHSSSTYRRLSRRSNRPPTSRRRRSCSTSRAARRASCSIGSSDSGSSPAATSNRTIRRSPGRAARGARGDGLEGRLAAAAPVHLDIHEIPERPDVPAHLHLDVRFLVTAVGTC